VLLALLALGGFNLLLDPYGAYRMASIEGLVEHRATNGTRRTKAETVSRGGWETVLLGSSVVATGFDTGRGLLESERAYNLGLAGSSLAEQAGALAVALSSREPPRRVVFLVDFEFFDSRRGVREDFLQSPFNSRYGRFEYHASNLLGAQSTENSLRSLRNLRRGSTSKYDSRGHRGRSLRRPGEPWSELFATERAPRPQEEALELDLQRMDLLDGMIGLCVEREVALFIAIPPVHAIRLERRYRMGDDAWIRWKRTLSDLVARRNGGLDAGVSPIVLRDFAVFSTYTTEEVPGEQDVDTELEWFWDGVHFQTRLGEIVLSRLLSSSGDVAAGTTTFGARLEPRSLDVHLSRDARARAGYRSTHDEAGRRTE